MNIFDRITLLKAGYTRKEIDQMIEEDKKAAEQPAPEPVQPEQKDPEPEKKPDPIPEEKPKEPEIDYRQEYEKEKAAKEALQAANRNRDNSNVKKKTDEEIVADLVGSFL